MHTLPCRQINGEAGSLVDLGLAVNIATMFLNNGMTDGEPQATAYAFTDCYFRMSALASSPLIMFLWMTYGLGV